MFWLIDVILYLIYRTGGPPLIIFVQSLIITSTYTILLFVCKYITGNWRIAAFSTLFAVALGINDWNVRPQSIAFLVGVLFILAIKKLQNFEDIRWVIIFPIGMFIWVNSHGSFIIGFVLILIWLLDEVRIYSFEPTIKQKTYLIYGFAIITISRFYMYIKPSPESSMYKHCRGTVIQNLVPEWSPNLRSSLNIFYNYYCYLLF
jgi:hypothetical protein